MDQSGQTDFSHFTPQNAIHALRNADQWTKVAKLKVECFHYRMPHIHLLLQQLSRNSVPIKSKCGMATLIQGSSLAPVNTNSPLGPNWPSSNSGFLLAKSSPGPTWPCSISGFLQAKSLLGPNWPSSMSAFLSTKSLLGPKWPT